MERRERHRWIETVLVAVAACSGPANTVLFDESGLMPPQAGGGAAGASDQLSGAAGTDDGGDRGTAMGGGVMAGGGSSGGGSAGTRTDGGGGMAVTCPANCASDADCNVVAGVATCACRSGFVGSGSVCKRPTSCHQLHLAEPQSKSGAYLIAPVAANAPFMAYCEMVAEGGGWTLVLNDGPAFSQATSGVAGAQCYREGCTSLAYSTVPIDGDVMLDVGNVALVADNQLARIVITGVASATRGQTVRALISTGPSYLEKEDNSNLVVRLKGAESCEDTLPTDMAGLVCTSCMAGEACDAPVLVFGDDDPGCVDTPSRFAIGGAINYSEPWGNCAGWPQSPTIGDIQYFPQHFRIWVR